jgi:FixJ family two-component response regulator
MEGRGWVAVVDDDASVRRSLVRLLRGNGIRVESFSSLADCLRRSLDEQPACLVLDRNLGGPPEAAALGAIAGAHRSSG